MDDLSGISPEVLISGLQSNDLVSGKYYLIEEDERFPLQPTGEWQQFISGQTVKIPKSPLIYVLSGYNVQYIGKDYNGTRGNEHRTELIRDDHSNPYMQNVVNAHGLSGFFYQPLIVLPQDTIEHINIIENAYIKYFDTYHNGYNLREFSDTPMLGRKLSEETKRKISEAHKGKKKQPCSQERREYLSKSMRGEGNHFYGKKHTEEAKRKISEKNSGENSPLYGKRGELHHLFGKKLSDEHKAKISRPGALSPNFGKKASPETRAKISKARMGISPANKGVLHSEEAKRKMSEQAQKNAHKKFKPLEMISPEGVLTHFISRAEFCKVNSVTRSGLQRVLSGERRSVGGWTKPK